MARSFLQVAATEEVASPLRVVQIEGLHTSVMFKINKTTVEQTSRLNKALLGKWCWRFASEQDSLWKQVIVRKFGEEEGCWCSGASRESHGMGLWKAIRNGWMEFSKRVAFKVGMVEECGFGRIGGVERILWKRLFQVCALLPPSGMLG
ncbi:hypothetical protein CK203_047098 [Vitis vinifera]|uniref:Uncharacterized protein n=1 Tax=Vitis vinifera TaxID=29760 RepID=A0A438HDP5_VITVI|nr:hypothetical protein CK203_047098 [Vitis vinifera]